MALLKQTFLDCSLCYLHFFFFCEYAMWLIISLIGRAEYKRLAIHDFMHASAKWRVLISRRERLLSPRKERLSYVHTIYISTLILN